MPDWSVNTTSGHGRMGGRETQPADQHPESEYNKDSRQYHTFGKGTIIPRAGFGYNPADGLAGIPIVDVEEEEVDIGGGNVQFNTQSKVYRPGDPNHPFAQKEVEQCPPPATPQNSEMKTSQQQPEPSNQMARTSKTQDELSKLLSEITPSDSQQSPPPQSSMETTMETSETNTSRSSTTQQDSSTECSPPKSSKKRSTRSSTPGATNEKLSQLTRLVGLQSQLHSEQMQDLTQAISSLATNLGSQLKEAISPSPEPTVQESIPTPEPKEAPAQESELLRIEGTFGSFTCSVDQVSTSHTPGGQLVVLVFDPNKPHMLPQPSEDPIRLWVGQGDDQRSIMAMAYGLSFEMEVLGQKKVIALLRALEQA